MEINKKGNPFIEMVKLDTLMGIVNAENGMNNSNNKKLLSQLKTCIKLQIKNPSVSHMDISTGKVLDLDYLRLQKKKLIDFMKSKK